MLMKHYLFAISTFICLLLLPCKILPQTEVMRTDSLLMPTKIPNTIAGVDSIVVDSVKIKKEKLDAPVHYLAKDSMVFTKGNFGYLYGEAEVKYQKIGIKGEKITMNMDSSTVAATFGVDSLGKEFGYPVFDDKGTQYEMKNMRYNFKTEKAFINHVVTEQGEGYIVAGESKKNADNSFYMVNAKYTTCDKHDHPDFYLNLTRAKVRPKKDVVTGPAYLVIADVPLPIALPFAFFPFNESYSSGVIMPSYGDEMSRGFYLHNGGYYFAISDYVDLALTGEIYTKGTWGVGARSVYRKRYKFSGNVNAYYLKTILGDKGFPDYSVSKDFRINWTHSQDRKANMYRTLSASVNFSTSSYNQRSQATLYSRQSTQTTKSSSVNLTQRFPDSPWSLSASMNVNQISRDSTISATLPNVSVSMSRIYPFKRKDAVGNERWYEKISISYSGEFRNSIRTKEDRIFKSNLIRDWENGVRHNIPISATFNLFDYIQVSPSINYNERWYTGKEKQAWDPVRQRNSVVDTLYGFNRVYDYNVSMTFSTKLYGMYKPWKMFGDKINGIRHVFSPDISFSYLPDFSSPRYGFYETYSYKDAQGNDMYYTYSPYANMIFGAPSSGKQGNISFNFKNNVEMKLKSDKDSIGFVKKSLIDDLGIRFSYNMMADSLKWSTIGTGIRLKLTKSYTLNLNAQWEPYMYEVNKNGSPVRVNKLRIMNGKGFGKLISTGTSFSYSFNQSTFKKWFGGEGDNGSEKDNDTQDEAEATLPDDGTMGENPHEKSRGSLMGHTDDNSDKYDEYGYSKTGIVWNVGINYSLQYSGLAEFDKEKMRHRGRLTHNFGLNGSIQPTKNWNFTFSTDYNFDQKKFTYVNCSITRDLHCWSMSASFVPVGPYTSYNFSIRAKSSLLQDLKYEQSSSQYSSRVIDWY